MLEGWLENTRSGTLSLVWVKDGGWTGDPSPSRVSYGILYSSLSCAPSPASSP